MNPGKLAIITFAPPPAPPQSQAYTVVGYSTHTNNDAFTGNTFVMSVPPLTQDGDIMIWGVVEDEPAVGAFPTGWVPQANQTFSADEGSCHFATRIADDEPAEYTYTVESSDEGMHSSILLVLRRTGALQFDEILLYVDNTPTAGPWDFPLTEISTQEQNEVILLWGTIDNISAETVTFTPPNGYAKHAEVSTDWTSLFVAGRVKLNAGLESVMAAASGTVNGTAGKIAAIMTLKSGVALPPPPPPPPPPETVDVRYIRDWLGGSAAFNGNSSSYWVEIQAVNAAGQNVAIGATVTNNFGETDTAALVDGDINSELSLVVAPGPGDYWVKVDLGQIIPLTEIKIWHYYADGRIFANTKTEIATVDGSWTPIFDSAVDGTYAESANGRVHTAPFDSSGDPSGETPRPIPALTVNLADYGGLPSTTGLALETAFEDAFADLHAQGGGTLVINPGTYNFGNRALANATCVWIPAATDIRVSAYGAKLVMNTIEHTTPIFLNFNAPSNVTVEGMEFEDTGSDISIGTGRGAVCIWVGPNAVGSGFKTKDIIADNVVIMVACDQRDGTQYGFSGFDIHGTARNSYYGVQMLKTGQFSTLDIATENVRRAVIMHGAKNWTINANVSRTGGLGSNACVTLSAFADAPVEDCNVTITATGALNAYGCLGQIIHQDAPGDYSYADNVKFNVNPVNVSSPAYLGFVNFSAEPEAGGGKLSSTAGEWQNIEIRGTVTGSYSGAMVANESPSTADANSIKVASNLWGFQSGLPSYFSQL